MYIATKKHLLCHCPLSACIKSLQKSTFEENSELYEEHLVFFFFFEVWFVALDDFPTGYGDWAEHNDVCLCRLYIPILNSPAYFNSESTRQILITQLPNISV